MAQRGCMIACPVCHMVLSSPGACPLCGSDVRGEGEFDSRGERAIQEETDSVDLPFGLGDETPSQPTTSLPFGIERAPEVPSEAPETLSEADTATEAPILPFGIEGAPETPPDEALSTDEESTTTDLPFGIEDSPTESPPETENLPSKMSRNQPSKLPFGIDHMHHTPIE